MRRMIAPPRRSGRDGTVERDAPEEGACDEDPSVGSEDQSEVVVGIEGSDEAVDTQRDDARCCQKHATAFAGAPCQIR